jgi:dihydropteroate synthase
MLQGAHIIRTHDVKACVDAARITDALLKAGSQESVVDTQQKSRTDS